MQSPLQVTPQDDYHMLINDFLQTGLLDDEIDIGQSSTTSSEQSIASSSATASTYECCGMSIRDLHDLLHHLEAYHDEDDFEEANLPVPPPLSISTSNSRTGSPSPYESPTYSPILGSPLVLPYDPLSALQLGAPILPLADTVSISLADISAPQPVSKSSGVVSFIPGLPAKSRFVHPTPLGRTPPPMPSFINMSTSTIKRPRSREHPYTSKPTSRLSNRRPSARTITAAAMAEKMKKPRKYVHERFVNMRNAHLQQEKELEMMTVSIPSPPQSTNLSSSGSSSSEDDGDDDNLSDLESVNESMQLDDDNRNTMVLTRYGRLRHVQPDEINDADVIGIVIGKADAENDEDDIPLSDLALEKLMPGCIIRQLPQRVQMKGTNTINIVPGYTVYRCTVAGCTKKYKHDNGLKMHLKNQHPEYAQQQRHEHSKSKENGDSVVEPITSMMPSPANDDIQSPFSTTPSATAESQECIFAMPEDPFNKPVAPNFLFPRDFQPHLYDPSIRDRHDYSCHFVGCLKSYKNGSGIRYHLRTHLHPQQMAEAEFAKQGAEEAESSNDAESNLDTPMTPVTDDTTPNTNKQT